MTNNVPILYSFRHCPYVIRARMALIYAGIPIAIREVELKNNYAEIADCKETRSTWLEKAPKNRGLYTSHIAIVSSRLPFVSSRMRTLSTRIGIGSAQVRNEGDK